jgi:polysaccharide biosynthesis/export protein ExoF
MNTRRKVAHDRKQTARLPIVGMALAAMLATLIPNAAFAETGYRLGARDKLRLKVNEWRAARGEVHEWEALNGDYTVSAAGTVSIPLVGEVRASSLTPAELSETIAERLRSVAGLLQKPSASVEVAEYRPFFITGHVERPGEFPYRPGLTVLQAVSVAGGHYRLPDPGLLRFGRDALQGRGELRTMETERLALLARRGRLQAEIAGQPEIGFSAELTGIQGDTLVAQILNEERQIFASRRAALASQVAALQQTQKLFVQEVAVLKEKTVSLERQLALAKRELEGVTGLVNRGLAVTSRQLTLEQNAAQFQSQQLDLSLAMLRANQEISRSERTVIDLQNQRKTETLDLLRETQNRIAALGERMSAARNLVFEAEITAPQLATNRMTDPARQPTYSILRSVDGQVTAEKATEADAVLPGDVVKVERAVPAASQSVQTASPVVQ